MCLYLLFFIRHMQHPFNHFLKYQDLVMDVSSYYKRFPEYRTAHILFRVRVKPSKDEALAAQAKVDSKVDKSIKQSTKDKGSSNQNINTQTIKIVLPPTPIKKKKKKSSNTGKKKAEAIEQLKTDLEKFTQLKNLAKQKNIPIYSFNEISIYQLTRFIKFIN